LSAPIFFENNSLNIFLFEKIVVYLHMKQKTTGMT